MAKTLHYDFLTNPTLTGSEHPVATSPTLSITRATKATMVDADGYIREVQAGEARFTGATFRNNEMLYSEDLSNAAWAMVAGNKGSESATRYTGETATVGYIVDDGVAANVRLQQQWRTDGTVGEVYVLSAYLKKRGANGRWGYILAADDGIAAYFDLVNGVVGTETNSPQAAITDEGNGWYRCSIVTTATDASPRINIYVAEGDNDVGIDTPDTTYSIYVDAVQAEVVSGSGRTTPSTYIPTTDSIISSLTGTSTKGLLAEEARTNICLQSADFSTTWAATGTSVVSTNAAVAPDGSMTADTLTDDDGSGFEFIQQNVPYTAGTTSALSVFLKKDSTPSTTRFPSFRVRFNGGTAQQWDVKVDTSTGDSDVVQIAGSAGSMTVTVEDFSTDYWRVHMICTDGDNGNSSHQIQIFPALGAGAITSGGSSAATGSITIWGFMVEASSSFVSSYIPTTTASVTRNADDVSTTDLSWLTDSVGTLYADVTGGLWAGLGSSGVDYQFLSIHDAGYTNQILLDVANSDSRLVAGGNVFPNTNVWNADEFSAKLAAGYATNDLALYENGTSRGTESTATIPTGMTDLEVGNGEFNFWNGHIAEIAYFNERLANATLEDYSLNGLPTAFPGTVAGDGGHIWPARSNDPRWAQIITDSGITPSGNFIDDVHAALEAMASDTGAMDDLWKKVKAIYSITDTSEPFTY